MFGSLSAREQEVLGLIAEGMSNQEITVRLGVREPTVRRHISNLYTKLNVTNRIQATQMVYRERLQAKQAEIDALRKHIADAQPEFRALAFYLKRAVVLFAELSEYPE